MKPKTRLSNHTLIKDLSMMVLDPAEKLRTQTLYISKKDMDERLTVGHF